MTSKVVEFVSTPGPKRSDIWDTVLQGFGVRVSPTGRKAWFVMVRPDGRPKRVSIGTYPAISLADAREQACKISHDVQLGVFEKPTEPETPTLGETVSLTQIGRRSMNDKPATKPVVELVTLKQLCTELKIDPREARERLRLAVRDAKKHPELAKSHKPGHAWDWAKNSPALKEARTALTA